MKSPSAVQRAFPLTALQEGMLYHTIREPDFRHYHGQCTAVLEGPLHDQAFLDAWVLAAARHEVFRTLYSWERRERPIQVVLEEVKPEVRFLDWTGRDPKEQREQWESLLLEDRQRPFDLSTAPVMRLVVAHIASERAHFLWSVSHILLDGWSAMTVLGEVLEDYSALVENRPVDRPSPPSYAQFVGWQSARDVSADVSYWREQLEGFAGPTALPTDNSSPSSRDRLIAEISLTRDETAACVKAAAQLRVTLNTLTAAAWALLLGRYAHTDDVVFGVTVTERPTDISNVDRAAGLYLNTLPVRVAIRDHAEVGQWISQLQRDMSSGRAHSAITLSTLTRGRPADRRQLFDSVMVFESFPDWVMNSGDGLLKTAFLTIDAPSHLPLAFLAYPGDELKLQIVHDPARISARHAAVLLRQLRGLLLDLSKDASRPLRDVTLVASSDSSVVTAVEDEGPSAHPSSAHVVQPSRKREEPWPDVIRLFEERVRKQPAAAAVRNAGGTVSYRDLNGAAAAYANRIAAHGLGSGALVGIIARRTPEVVAAILGALKAGCAYVPIDPTQPLRRMRAQSELCHLIVATSTDMSMLTDLTTPRLVLNSPIDTVYDDFVGGHDGVTDPGPADTAAYVIFTSGSTGEPKGVVVERRHLAWSTDARFQHYHTHPGCFLLMSSLSVDSSIAGLFWTLAAGGTLLLPDMRAEQDLGALIQLMETAKVTHTLMVPSLYGAILEHALPHQLRALQLVVVAGEACPSAVVKLHREKLPGTALHNEYGPSEATVWASVEVLTEHCNGPVLIGNAVPGATLYVLDHNLNVVAAGEPGEICIGGAGIARGYLDQHEETARAFVLDPFRPGARMYRTGDRGRWTESGRLEFLGRVDDQIKWRGYRIEPLEVERALEQHAGIAAALVMITSVPAPSDTASTVEHLVDALMERSESDVDALLRSIMRSS